MKRLLTVIGLIVLTLTASAANKSWTLSKSTCTSSSGSDSPWTFNNNFSISENSNKTLAFGNDDGIKYSVGVQYTINIPSGESIKRITFTGYDNYADTDSYLGELNGTNYNSKDYVWPKKDANGNATTVSHTITFSTDVTGTLTFTPEGKQVVWRIILYNYEDTPVNPDQPVTVSQMETLDRGLVALPAQGGTGNFVSWRLLGTDDKAKTTFDLKRGGTTIATDLTVTNYTDAEGTTSSQYQVITKVDGTITETSDAVSPWSDVYKKLVLDRPAAVGSVTYSPNDCSVGDVDGDGQYELFVKWDPSNSKDNSQNGKTDRVYIDCYRLDGTKLWRIDLGYNIRAGAHYTQFLVYDFDGDGRAELICKTAPGTKDGTGAYVSAAATDSEISSTNNSTTYRNSNGHILTGPEFLTVFNGETGAAVHTVFYNPNRTFGCGGSPTYSSSWGDSYGNRGERYLATVAFLDGTNRKPSAIFCRGYYTRAYVWAVDFNGTTLTTKWLHASESNSQYKLTDSNNTTNTYTPGIATRGSGSKTLYANGNHNLSVADVDDDGCDEIIWGSGALDQDGKLLYATGFGHGDAIHLADHNPDRPGLEVFQIHEESSYGWDLHDAATGEILFSATGSEDNGRGIAAQLSGDVRGSWFSSSNDRNQRSAVTGEVVKEKSSTLNFRIYWDGDPQDELLDGNVIDKWNGSGFSRLFTVYNAGPGNTCNSTKKTPNLQADILGDWREELVLWAEEDGGCVLGIYSTNIPTAYRVPTLMHDHTYRMGITWQNTAYNQPPHLGYYLPDNAIKEGEDPIYAAAATIIEDEELQPTDEGIYLPVVTVTNNDFELNDQIVTPTLTASFSNLSGIKQVVTLKGETLFSEDYESAVDASSWTNGGATLELVTGDATYGNYIHHSMNGTNIAANRSAYTLFDNLNLSGVESYAIDFDAFITAGNVVDRSVTDLVVMSKGAVIPTTKNVGYNWTNSNTEGTNYLFRMTAANSQSFTINETTALDLPKAWIHYQIIVNTIARTAQYTLTQGSAIIASGSFSLPEGTSSEVYGLFILDGRGIGDSKFDNISIYKTDELKYTFAEPGTLTVTTRYAGCLANEATYAADFIGTKISAAGWTTLGCKYPLAFSDTGLDAAYIVDAGNSTDESAKLLVVNSVPASTGLLLQGTAGTYRLPIETTPDPLETTNKLTAVTAKSGYTATDATYVLAKKSNGVGFYQCSAGVKVPVGKAYLTLGNNARPFIGFDETTGIILIDESRFMVQGESGTAYDLQGRRIGQPMQRGLYIVDGKKYFKM